MKKFKNYEEYLPTEIDWSQDFEAFEKMDGSMIILFFSELASKWIMASRGSFTSEQAVEAQKMIDSKVGVLDILNKNCTYIFDIIYPQNQIVVFYGNRRELVLLTKIDTESGYEYNNGSLVIDYSEYFTIVKKLELKSFNDLRETIMKGEDNKEGFVIKFANGERIKMKYAEYCRLHSIVTNVSNLVVWEHLMNHCNFDELIDRVPNEFFSWLNKTIKDLQQDFNEIERQSLKEFYRIYYIDGIGVNGNKKNFAMEVINTKYESILFKIYNKQPYDEIIWKLIRPKYSKPFQDGYEVQKGSYFKYEESK